MVDVPTLPIDGSYWYLSVPLLDNILPANSISIDGICKVRIQDSNLTYITTIVDCKGEKIFHRTVEIPYLLFYASVVPGEDSDPDEMDNLHEFILQCREKWQNRGMLSMLFLISVHLMSPSFCQNGEDNYFPDFLTTSN